MAKEVEIGLANIPPDYNTAKCFHLGTGIMSLKFGAMIVFLRLYHYDRNEHGRKMCGIALSIWVNLIQAQVLMIH